MEILEILDCKYIGFLCICHGLNTKSKLKAPYYDPSNEHRKETPLKELRLTLDI